MSWVFCFVFFFFPRLKRDRPPLASSTAHVGTGEEEEVGLGLFTFSGFRLRVGSTLTGAGLSLVPHGLGTFDPDQSRLSQHCNNTMIVVKNIAVAVLWCVGDAKSDTLHPFIPSSLVLWDYKVKVKLILNGSKQLEKRSRKWFLAGKRHCCSIYVFMYIHTYMSV